MDATMSPSYYNMNNNMITSSHTEQPQPSQYRWNKATSSSLMTTNTLPPEHSQVAADQFQTQELQVKHVQESHVQQTISGNGMDVSTKQQQQQLWQNHQQLPQQSQTYSHDGFLTPAIELMPEPPPYEEFNIEWSGVDMPLPPTQLEFGEATQLLNPDEENYIFSQFFDELDGNPEFLFNPDLPPNMPPYNEHNGVESAHLTTSFSPNVMLSGNNGFSLQVSETANNAHNQIVDNASNSTSLSPRTENLHLSNSPKAKNSRLPSPTNETVIASSSNNRTVPAKRKQLEEDSKSSRRSSNPRLTINTKIGTSTANNIATGLSDQRTGSPLAQLSNLSIENSTTNTAMNQNGAESNCDSNNNTPPPSPPDIKSELRDDLDDDEPGSNGGSKSSRKPYKELLTEEEKRANHIASEQKRRNTIRAGFKELTDIIPTLKNVNNSKSTILFKAVDYIKYLERRNRNLKERSHLLEMRVEMQMRSGKNFHHHSGPYGPPIGFGHQRVAPMPISNPYGIPNGVNGMGIPILAHSAPQQHVIGGPQHVQNIFVSPPQDNPQMMAFNGANLNNVFRRSNGSISIPAQMMDNKQLIPQGAMSIPADEHQQISSKDTEMTTSNGSIVVKS